jgi:hypothetical protein
MQILGMFLFGTAAGLIVFASGGSEHSERRRGNPKSSGFRNMVIHHMQTFKFFKSTFLKHVPGGSKVGVQFLAGSKAQRRGPPRTEKL